MFLQYYSSMIVLIPAMIFTMIVQSKIKSTFKHYMKVENSTKLTGANAARQVLDANGLNNVVINRINGEALNNYFDPKNNTVNLSNEVYTEDTVGAVSVACHEVGHAIQYAVDYKPIKMRNAIVPLVNFTSGLAWPLIILGLFMSSASAYSDLFFNLGTIFFTVVILFHLITLPVEFNASSRAISQMQELNLVSTRDVRGSKKVLHAAAMTYVASLAVAVATLLRILILRGSRN